MPKYIIMTERGGKFWNCSIASTPKIHESLLEAETEAKRLAPILLKEHKVPVILEVKARVETKIVTETKSVTVWE